MKRKLALLLAGSMALTAVPVQTIFAANGQLALGDVLDTPTKTTTTQTAVIVVGDGVQTFTSEGAFTFELVNAKLVDDSNATNGTAVTDTIYNADGTTTTAVGSTATRSGSYKINVLANGNIHPTFQFEYTVVDVNKPAYIKCLSTNTDTTFEGKQVQISKVLGSTSVTGKVTKKASQQSLGSATGGKVTITSDYKDAFEKGDIYSITIPSGYSFKNTSAITVDVTGGDTGMPASLTPTVATDTTTPVIFYASTSNDRTLYLKFTDDWSDNANVFGTTFTVNGLDISNNNSVYNKDVELTVKKGSSVVGSGTIVNFSTFRLQTEIDDEAEIPTIQAGITQVESADKFDYGTVSNDTFTKKGTVNVYDQINAFASTSLNNTVTFNISEALANSYRGGDLIITLPEGVTITGAELVDQSTTQNLDSGAGLFLNSATTTPDPDDYKDGYVWDLSDGPTVYDNWTIRKNVLTIKDVSSQDATTMDIDVTLEIQTGITFSGDVTATLTSGKNAIDVIEPIKIGTIAKVESVIEVKSSTTDVLVGYTSQDASDITITEKKAGTMVEGDKFTIELTDDVSTSTAAKNYGINAGKASVVAGNAEVSTKVDGNKIYVTIESIENDNTPVSIKVSGIKVFSDRNVPTYNGDADVIKFKVSSPEVIQVPVSGSYIKFVNSLTEATTSVYNQDVVVALGGTQATLADGTKVDLYGAPYIDAAGNTMMPVKGAGFALGLKAEDIVYDSANKTATFFLLDGGIAQITAGQTYATVNGVKIPLLDAKGNLVAPVVKDGRFYLPLRAASKTVFGVEVNYDAAAKTVTLNPTK